MRHSATSRAAKSAAVALFAGLSGMGTQANAQDKLAGDAGAVMAELTGNRGQIVLMAADRVTPKGRLATYFTCSADGSEGYVVETNASLRHQPTKAAVRDVVTDCSFHDVEFEDVDPPRLSFNKDAAYKDCERLMATKPDFNGCGYVDDQMMLARQDGFRIAYMGRTEQKEGGKLLLFTVRPEDGEAEMEYVTRSGATFDFDFAGYDRFAYNPAIQDKLDARRRQASLQLD
ncbi:hypothetical protein [Parvularcula sp. LCG005]|uniref:hypothetical protein n=1 Tax=Parvularcula sp. LCG005 TaxID=3078805 RepID=UPI0029437F3D|nr:hypothetical protein [Parvularcula sp. LCG005]WOI52995.1 hypothetical protein RUI03_12635 [Parvularcula sp. LCG005]